MNSDTEDNLCWFHGRLARDDADKVLKEGWRSLNRKAKKKFERKPQN